jgi:uroporphyrinogen decarboxylase
MPLLPPQHPLASGITADAPLLAAYTGRTPTRRPVWFMRQAGRSLPEYREARAGTGMLQACLTSELAAEITVQPVTRHDVDAGIFFSDIVVPLKLAGVDVDIEPGVGPVFGEAISTPEQVAALPTLTDEALEPIREAVRLTVARLGSTPLIGFAGAPFTLAAYMVQGRPSRDHLAARRLMHADPETWAALCTWTAEVSSRFLAAQIEAGASAAQLFDSWGGSLARRDYENLVAPSSSKVLSTAASYGVPVVHFGVGTSDLLVSMHAAGGTVMGVDYRLDLDAAEARLGGGVPLQGNIDPALLGAGWEPLRAHTLDVLTRGAAAPGHVVNLGHGVPADTDPTVLTRLVDFIHSVPVDADPAAWAQTQPQEA